MARSQYYGSSYLDYLSFPNPHLCFFFIVVFFVLSLTWYLNYESIIEDTMNQLKIVFMLSPLFLLLLVHFFSGGLSFYVPWPDQDSIHRAGASPWGVAALLVLILFMVSYQSGIQEMWFPFGGIKVKPLVQQEGLQKATQVQLRPITKSEYEPNKPNMKPSSSQRSSGSEEDKAAPHTSHTNRTACSQGERIDTRNRFDILGSLTNTRFCQVSEDEKD